MIGPGELLLEQNKESRLVSCIDLGISSTSLLLVSK